VFFFTDTTVRNLTIIPLKPNPAPTDYNPPTRRRILLNECERCAPAAFVVNEVPTTHLANIHSVHSFVTRYSRCLMFSVYVITKCLSPPPMGVSPTFNKPPHRAIHANIAWITPGLSFRCLLRYRRRSVIIYLKGRVNNWTWPNLR
jgi:hypothetical protein